MANYQYIFIINPISGAARDRQKLVRQIHSNFSSHRYNILYTEGPGHASQLAAEVDDGEDKIVVAVGGDGTMNEVASGLVGRQVALGLVPRGSGNGFARSIGVPMPTGQALEVLKEPQIKLIDGAKINGRYFFGVAGVGLDAQISVDFQSFGHRGPLPYFYLGLKSYLDYKYPQFTLRYAHQELKVKPTLITFANSRQFGNNAIIAPQANMADGLLDICIVERFPLQEGLAELRRLFNGNIDKSPYYKSFRTDKLEVENPTGSYHVDGEPCSAGYELHISSVPDALRIAVPAK